MKHLVTVSSVFVAMAVAAPVVRAEPASSSPSSSAEPTGTVSPVLATVLSIGGTAAAAATFAVGVRGNGNATEIALGLTGAVVLPSLGRWYAHTPAVGGLIARAAGIGLLVGSYYIGYHQEHLDLGYTMLIAGSAAFVSGTIYDIVQAPRDALSFNAHLKDVAIVPVLQPDHHGLGVALSARF